MRRLLSDALLFILPLLFLAAELAQGALLGNKWEATNFCKCICFGTNYTILHLAIPDNPSKPCLSCTKQWCMDQQLPICAGASLGDTNPDTSTGKDGDIEARCFQRDSPRDQLVVTLFLLTVFGLLLGAGIKGKMMKAGFDSKTFGWDPNRKWWEVWFPRSQDDGIALDERLPEPRRSGVSGGSRSREREREREREDRPDRQGDYFTIGDEA